MRNIAARDFSLDSSYSLPIASLDVEDGCLAREVFLCRLIYITTIIVTRQNMKPPMPAATGITYDAAKTLYQCTYTSTVFDLQHY